MQKIIDGNEAAAYVAYAFTEIASLYPITPSTKMTELVEKWSAQGKKNSFDQPVETIQMESENGSAGVMYGAAKAGALASTFTCSQGLLLMTPTIYKLAGEQLPGVVHVAARAIATSALSIYGDHSDVMALRQTGAIILSSSSVQTAALYSAVAHLAAVQYHLPVIHFFDGFDTSHELRKVTVPTYRQLSKSIDTRAFESFKENGVSNLDPKASGTSQMPDLYFQQREAVNPVYLEAVAGIEEILQSLNPLFDSLSSTVEYFGAANAKKVIVLMGSAASTAKEVVEKLLANEEVGVITLHLYRPFPATLFLKRLPETVEDICVMDRTKEPGGTGEPLLLDVQRMIAESRSNIKVNGCRYGLGGKEVTPEQIAAVFHEMGDWQNKQSAVVGINDDLTKLSLKVKEEHALPESDAKEVILLGTASDGMVTGTQDLTRLIGGLTELDVQARFEFSPIKSRHVTQSFLRLSPKPIFASYNCSSADLIVLAQASYLKYEAILKKLKPNGKLLINFSGSIEGLLHHCSAEIRNHLIEKKIELFLVPASHLARNYQLGPKISCLMITALLEITSYVPNQQALARYQELLEDADYMLDTEYRHSVYQAMEEIKQQIRQVTLSSSEAFAEETSSIVSKNRLAKITQACQNFKGNEISTKDLFDHQLQSGAFPLTDQDSLISLDLEQAPCWQAENCLKCNLCSAVCPHSAIQPQLNANERIGEEQSLPYDEQTAFSLEIDLEKCTGCLLCQEVCPAQSKALVKKEIPEVASERVPKLEASEVVFPKNDHSLRTSQFNKPLLQASGACPGCGETPYLKLLTQLFGERLSIANATGCSSIWGASAPFVAYRRNEEGHGPIWANSLFENNSSFGLGMKLGFDRTRKNCFEQLGKVTKDTTYPAKLRRLCQQLIDEQGRNAATIVSFMETTKDTLDTRILRLRAKSHYLINRTHWIVGGDGWAYDIDFNGIDRLLAQNENVNILILDNSGYANTGGQASSAVEKNVTVKLASNGKKTIKKDLALYAMQYPNAYIAQVSLFADAKQTHRAFVEAERHEGVSIIIAYAHCVLHKSTYSGIEESRLATESGYWPLFRYDPNKRRRFKLDTSHFSEKYLEQYLRSQPRFSAIMKDQEKQKELVTTIKRRQRNYALMTELFNQ